MIWDALHIEIITAKLPSDYFKVLWVSLYTVQSERRFKIIIPSMPTWYFLKISRIDKNKVLESVKGPQEEILYKYSGLMQDSYNPQDSQRNRKILSQLSYKILSQLSYGILKDS